MIDQGMHGGGDGWGGVWYVAAAALVAVGLLLWWRRHQRIKAAAGHEWHTLHQFDSPPMVAYDSNQMRKADAVAMAHSLRALHCGVWAACHTIYGGKHDMALARVVLNRAYTYEGKPVPIKLYRRSGLIHMRPTGTARMYLLFALEVHQLFRAWHLGHEQYGKPGPDDVPGLLKWGRAIAACKKLAGGYA